jgi:hypothetical protein
MKPALNTSVRHMIACKWPRPSITQGRVKNRSSDMPGKKDNTQNKTTNMN